jgi:hypothetical protein
MMNAPLASEFSFTSPRVRGEVGLRASAIRVRGPLSESEFGEMPPHPNPLPARGERGQTVLGLEV